MNDRDFTIRKNILDLEHSEKLSRGITEIGIGIGGSVSVIGFILNKDFLIGIVMGAIFGLLFLTDGVKKLHECKRIREDIENLRDSF